MGSGKHREVGKSRVNSANRSESRTTKNLSGRTKPFCRKSKAGTMKRRDFKASKVQTERRGRRNAECGVRIDFGELSRVAKWGSGEGITVRQAHRRRVTDHGPRITTTKNLTGRTKPFCRKPKARRGKRRVVSSAGAEERGRRRSAVGGTGC